MNASMVGNPISWNTMPTEAEISMYALLMNMVSTNEQSNVVFHVCSVSM